MRFTLSISRPTWANRSIVKTLVLGACIAFWNSFTIYGGIQLVAQRVGNEFELVSIPILMYLLIGIVMLVVTEELTRRFSKRTIILGGLSLTVVGTLGMQLVSSLPLFALVFLILGMGYSPTISSIASLLFSYLPRDLAIMRGGRQSFVNINCAASAIASIGIPIVMKGHSGLFMVLGLLSIAVSFCIIWSMKTGQAVLVLSAPVDKTTLFRRMIDTQTLNAIWPYGFVVTCVQMISFFLVFFIGIWGAAVIFCLEIGNSLSGSMLRRITEKLDKWSPSDKMRSHKIMAIFTLVGLALGMVLIQTRDVPLCMLGGFIAGICQRAANFCYSQLSVAKKTNLREGVYTNFVLSAGGQGLAAVLGLSGLGMWMFWVPVPLLVSGVVKYALQLRRGE